MTDIRGRIDELIEESYLAALPDEKIRQDVLQYLDSCYQCTDEMGLDDETHREALRKLDEFGHMAMRLDQAEELRDPEIASVELPEDEDTLAHRAARFKLMVIEALRGVDRTLAREIEQKRFPGIKSQPETALLPRQDITSVPVSSSNLQTGLLRILYAMLTGMTLFIIGYRLFAQ